MDKLDEHLLKRLNQTADVEGPFVPALVQGFAVVRVLMGHPAPVRPQSRVWSGEGPATPCASRRGPSSRETGVYLQETVLGCAPSLVRPGTTPLSLVLRNLGKSVPVPTGRQSKGAAPRESPVTRTHGSERRQSVQEPRREGTGGPPGSCRTCVSHPPDSRLPDLTRAVGTGSDESLAVPRRLRDLQTYSAGSARIVGSTSQTYRRDRSL